jgi:hypothetical protein
MRRRREPESRYAADNRVASNTWAYVTIALLAGALVGLFVLFWLL